MGGWGSHSWNPTLKRECSSFRIFPKREGIQNFPSNSGIVGGGGQLSLANTANPFSILYVSLEGLSLVESNQQMYDFYKRAIFKQ